MKDAAESHATQHTHAYVVAYTLAYFLLRCIAMHISMDTTEFLQESYLADQCAVV